MASAIDSGVDTGNDSNDSSVQEKLSKMDIGVDFSQEHKSLDSGKEISSGIEQEHQPQTSLRATMEDDNNRPTSSFMNLLQPKCLSHGYDFNKSFSNVEMNKRISEMFNVINPEVFVAGGPFGTERKEHRSIRSMIPSRFGRIRDGKYRMVSHALRTLAANPDYLRARDTARMCRAASHNNTQSLREMLESGVSPNCQDKYKRTPLHLASCMGFADTVKLLLDYGADPNIKDSIGNTPLHLAACTNHVAVITLLLKAGTRVTEKDLAGHSPLQLAITKFNIMKRAIMPHPVLKEQVCQVIAMLTEYMRRKEGPSVDPDLLNKFESLVRVSDSTEEMESNIRDLLSNLNSLSLSGPS